MKKKSPHIGIIIFVFLITVIYGIFEHSFTLVAFWTSGLFIPILFFRHHFSENIKPLTSLLILSYCTYTIYMYITNYIYIHNPNRDVFVAFDSVTFWGLANSHFSTWDEFIHAINNRFAVSFYFFHTINIIFVYLSSLIEDPNLLVLKWQCVFLGAFSIPYVYLILCRYLPRNSSYKYTLFFLMLSLVPFYSAVFLRDIHVYFFYVIGTYIICYWRSINAGLLKLIIIDIILLGLRPEHGLFFLVFLIAFVYLKIQKNIVLIFGSVIVGLIAIVFLSSTILNTFEETTEAYEGLRNHASSESTARTFTQLPIGVKQIALAINSQVAPAVPFWRTWYKDVHDIANYRRLNIQGYYTPWRFMESIGTTFNLFIWGFIIAGFRRKKIILNVFQHKEVLYLFIIALLLLLLATSDINARRIFCVYPILFLTGMLFYSKFTPTLKKAIFRNTTISIILLHILFLVIK